MGLIIIGYIIIKSAKNSSDRILQNNIIGKIQFDKNSILIRTSDKTHNIDKDFKGEIQFFFESYKEEVEGYTRRRNFYHGTNNKVNIKSDNQESTFYILIESTTDKKNFYKLIEWCWKNKIKTKEFTKGARTFNSKTLSYKEIQKFKEKYT